MTTDTKIQIGLVGACAVMTGLILRKRQQVTRDMAQLLLTTDTLVKTAGDIIERLDNECKEVTAATQYLEALQHNQRGTQSRRYPWVTTKLNDTLIPTEEVHDDGETY